MTRALKSTAIALGLTLAATSLTALPAAAKTLSRSEIGAAMINKTITTRRFGMRITMRYKPNGTVSAKSLLGTINGTWRYSGSNRVCTTFPSGPAKGTSCATYTKTGANSYRTSAGVSFRVN
ncbi:hypothetical protein ACFQ14_02895 [Pseudahrensia aquimaris]|uniref:Uncharacterized protein n=1 Tax=Pseudahrensia aquimaris TaxID=744461 RepID=A0ABW3FAA8_9HYPH